LGHPIYFQGISDAANLELLLYLGIEVFDTASFRMDGVRGIYHTNIGSIPFGEIERHGGVEVFCGCNACRKLQTSEQEDEILKAISDHNIHMMHQRMGQAIAALEIGQLRQVVMGRLAGNPTWMSALRSLEIHHFNEFSQHVPTYRKADRTLITYRDDLGNPDFSLWHQRILDEYIPIPGRKTLLLLPCSARKPYSTSRTHQRIRDALRSVKGWKARVQQVVMTSPLGAVPMELEDLYPASHYDIPVTGQWHPEEIDIIRILVGSIFQKGDYGNVICFHKEGHEFFEGGSAGTIFPGARFNDIHSEADKTGSDPYKLLCSTLSEVLGPGRGVNHEKEELMAQIKFALGIDISSISQLEVKWSRRGRELRKNKRPMIVFKKGGPVPTKEGGMILWDLLGPDDKRVVIDDFRPKGTVFSQGIISIHGAVRSGDIVLVGTENEYRGVGRALVPGIGGLQDIPGPAVKMLHTV
jgi:archaeosine synthase